MKSIGSQPVRNALMVTGLAIAATALLLLLGYAPTQHLGGPDAVLAMLVGCAISLIGSLAGALPMLCMPRETPQSLMNGQLAAMLVRMLVVLGLALAMALSGWFARSALLVWVAISYLVLLVPETLWVVRHSQGLSMSKRG